MHRLNFLLFRDCAVPGAAAACSLPSTASKSSVSWAGAVEMASTPEDDDDDDDDYAAPELAAPPEAGAAAAATVRSPSLSPCRLLQQKKIVESHGARFPISCATCACIRRRCAGKRWANRLLCQLARVFCARVHSVESCRAIRDGSGAGLPPIGEFERYGGVQWWKRVARVCARAVPLAAGSLAGVFLGAKVGSHIPEERLKQFFFVCMVLLGGRNVARAFTKIHG